MTASSRGSKAVASLMRLSRHPRICSDCIPSLSRPRRQYATAAEALKPVSESPTVSHVPPVTSAATITARHIVKSGILLSRPPLITRSLTPFENAFYFYQKRLNERLAMPFTRYFYFKKDTPADNDWKRKAKERNGSAARELGGYQAYGELGWNDEVLVGDAVSDPRTMMDALVKDAVTSTDGEESKVQQDAVSSEQGTEGPLQRWTQADKLGDMKRLDRKLARTLYLCVKGVEESWSFPSGSLIGRENLHQAAERILVQSAGVNMNTWIVGHAPIGYYFNRPERAANSSSRPPVEKTFFMKARIMAGQADLKNNLLGWKDFKWLTKQEVKKHVDPIYFDAIKNMMSDR